MVSTLFSHIEMIHGNNPWGKILDAGTGINSLSWISQLKSESWTAVTCAINMKADIQQIISARQRPQDRLLLGNWADSDFMVNERFDTVIADYLLGAVDGFVPYWQIPLLYRLKALTLNRLYFTGLEPYVPYNANCRAGHLVVSIGRLRDACLLLAGERPYREYPADWVIYHLQQIGFEIVDLKHYPINYGHNWLTGQMEMCRQRINTFVDRQLAMSMLEHINQLEQQALLCIAQQGSLKHGADYVISAKLAK
ncbi:hypothetical protein QE177_10890 [Arsenophonus sp. aPb]|uniref:hypothetical protein n=1 Tax=Arsenophonus sp. aPb TaxID=3041619 RepID=UPI00246929F2|nr:hypothetical protein [Arsenophonus sp. aPb]WGL97705.1 hypothetical protein QE177_10890 [Arsenophonus sp. aPb]